MELKKVDLKLTERSFGQETRFVFLGTKNQIINVNGFKVFRTREAALEALKAVGRTID